MNKLTTVYFQNFDLRTNKKKLHEWEENELIRDDNDEMQKPRKVITRDIHQRAGLVISDEEEKVNRVRCYSGFSEKRDGQRHFCSYSKPWRAEPKIVRLYAGYHSLWSSHERCNTSVGSINFELVDFLLPFYLNARFMKSDKIGKKRLEGWQLLRKTCL